MRPAPIPVDVDTHLERCVVGGPDGDLTGPIRPVEAILEWCDVGDGRPKPSFRMRITLEDGDLESLQTHGAFWLRIIGSRLPPFALELEDP